MYCETNIFSYKFYKEESKIYLTAMLYFNLFTIKYLGTMVRTIVLLNGDGAKLIDIPNYNYSFDSLSESILITPLIPT